MRMKIKLEFLFNNNCLFIDQDLPNLNQYFDNIVYSSSDLLVYNTSNLEVMISKEGTVSITTELKKTNDLKIQIKNVFSEYKKLTVLSNFFKLENTFKIIVPKENSRELVDELNRLDFDVNIHSAKENTLIAIEKNIFN